MTGMQLITLFFIAVSLSMDAFAVSISNGICTKGFGVRDGIRLGVFFGGFQFLMPTIGFLLGTSVQTYIQAADHWIAFLLLGGIGLTMVWEAMKGEEEESLCKNVPLTGKRLLMQAVATSVDALAVGISFALLKVNIWFSASVIGVVTFAVSFAGGFLGNKLGSLFRKRAQILGGIILIVIGARILWEHLM